MVFRTARRIAGGRSGALVHLRPFGKLSYDADAAAVQASTIYDLASLTKVIATTTMAMILVDEGKLPLDKPVRDFIPAFHGGDKDAVTVTRRITELGVLNPQYGVAYTQLAAAGVLAVLPPLILVLLFHRRIVRGLTEGFVKG